MVPLARCQALIEVSTVGLQDSFRGYSRRKRRLLQVRRLQYYDHSSLSLFSPKRTKASSQILGFFFSMSLHDAALNGDLEALRDRIERGDDVDGRDGAGWTPLIWACFEGHHECAQALIEAGAAVDMVDNDGKTALMSPATMVIMNVRKL